MNLAFVGGRRCWGLQALTSDVAALDDGGRWVVVLPFDGPAVCARFAVWERAVRRPAGPASVSGWRSSLDQTDFGKGVEAVRESIAADLSVAIRAFWVEDGSLHLGVGGGITGDSTGDGEWEETELKARRLLAVA